MYPDLFAPAFVTCSTNVGEGLIKLITFRYVPGHWVDVWRSGTFTEKSKYATDCNHRPCTTEQSTSVSLRDVSWVQKAISQLQSTEGMCMSTQCPDAPLNVISYEDRPSGKYGNSLKLWYNALGTQLHARRGKCAPFNSTWDRRGAETKGDVPCFMCQRRR